MKYKVEKVGNMWTFTDDGILIHKSHNQAELFAKALGCLQVRCETAEFFRDHYKAKLDKLNA